MDKIITITPKSRLWCDLKLREKREATKIENLPACLQAFRNAVDKAVSIILERRKAELDVTAVFDCLQERIYLAEEICYIIDDAFKKLRYSNMPHRGERIERLKNECCDRILKEMGYEEKEIIVIKLLTRKEKKTTTVNISKLIVCIFI